MKISEIIAFLEELKADIGDIHIGAHLEKSDDEELIFDEETDTLTGL